jgi:hypothetical protein
MTTVPLNRLGEREAAAIVARLAGNKEVEHSASIAYPSNQTLPCPTWPGLFIGRLGLASHFAIGSGPLVNTILKEYNRQ